MPELLEWIASGALLTIFSGILGLFYRSAVNAHKQRADEWFQAWQTERKISAENARQVTSVVTKVERAVEEVRE